MAFLEVILTWTVFGILSLALVLAPWFFGAWVMWWFWPFAVLLFLATFVLGLRLVVWGATPAHSEGRAGRTTNISETLVGEPREPRMSSWVVWLLLAYVPFLVYALVRFLQADVFMDAERSFLRQITACLVGGAILLGLNRTQRRALFVLLLIDLCLLGLYGIYNHLQNGSSHVLWYPGFVQYQSEPGGRATGSYFCPDHFSGVMELGLCAGLGLLFARERRWPWKLWGGALVGISACAILLSRSRGGGLAVVAILAAALVWGVTQWSGARRWFVRLCLASIVIVGAVIFWNSGHGYVERFQNYTAWNSVKGGDSQGELVHRVAEGVRTSDRGRMIGAAIRAWKTHPWIGIGPGMHQNLWFHFAATSDGNRQTGQWPSMTNAEFHSYEVHSDWMQLLEEYGMVGMALFLVPILWMTWLLLRGFRLESRERASADWEAVPEEHHDVLLTGWLAAVAMAFHSLGDFNLQMPATTWLLAAFVALALSHAMRLRRRAAFMTD